MGKQRLSLFRAERRQASITVNEFPVLFRDLFTGHQVVRIDVLSWLIEETRILRGNELRSQ